MRATLDPRTLTELLTPRLTLRRARADDLHAMHAVLSDERAMRYWSTPPHEHLEQTRAWLAGMIASPPSQGDDFVIVHEREVIGKMGAWRLPEFGFVLRPDRWRRGLAAEALTAFVAHVFATRDIDRLTADVDPRNAASLALLERHGFARTGYATGTWNTHIGVCDSVYLALDRKSDGRLSAS